MKIWIRKFQDCCDSCSILGIRFLFGHKLKYFERIFWLFCVILSSIFLAIFVEQNNFHGIFNIIITLKHSPTKISKVDFPAITICPAIGMKFGKNFEHNITKRCNWNSDILEYVLESCGYPTRYVERFQKITPSLNETIVGCFVRHEHFNCHQYFEEILTEKGICFRFSTNRIIPLIQTSRGTINEENLAKKNFDLVLKRSKITQPDFNEVFVKNLSPNIMFTIVLKYKMKEFRYCRPDFEGFLISLQPSKSAPVFQNEILKAFTGIHTNVKIDVREIDITKELETSDVDDKFCYMGTERKMEFFNEYNYENCFLECLSRITLKYCGCVTFYMPRNKITPVCGLEKYSWVKWSRNRIYQVLGEYYDVSSGNSEENCNYCVACRRLQYSGKVDYASIDVKYDFRNNSLSSYETAVVSFFTKQINLFSIERKEFWNFVDHLATFGGFCQLFLGISMYSLALLVSTVLIEPICYWLEKRKIKRKEMKCNILRTSFNRNAVYNIKIYDY